MIQAITVTNHLGESIRLELKNPQASGMLIKDVKGLGPVKADVNFTELATNDGGLDNSARLQKRNIVMTLIFLESPTIEDTRLNTYRYFPIKQNVTLTIETDSRTAYCVGRVEENSPTIFTKQEGCQISIVCGDPYFYSAGADGDTDTIFYGTVSMFSFPFSNESLTENLICFGEIRNQTEADIFYEGDAEIGITINMHAVGPMEGVIIYNTGTREMMRIDDEKLIDLTGSGILAGDDIVITTMRGNKGIHLFRNGEDINILNALGRPINWFRLSKGHNIFAYTASAGMGNLQFSIKNKTLYEGL